MSFIFLYFSSNSDSSTDEDLTISTPISRMAMSSPISVAAKILETQEIPETKLFPAIKRSNRILLNEPGKRDMIM